MQKARKSTIDPRLINEEMAWRGKTVMVSDNGTDWEEATFHTVLGDRCQCLNDSDEDELLPWVYARVSPQQWRTPNILEAEEHCEVQCRQDASDDWVGGYQLVALNHAKRQYVVRSPTNSGFEYFIYECCRILDKSMATAVKPKRSARRRKPKKG